MGHFFRLGYQVWVYNNVCICLHNILYIANLIIYLFSFHRYHHHDVSKISIQLFALKDLFKKNNKYITITKNKC